jgi:4-amino-4-deoxy-L-arabinose transferase-like glycosyltransferase
MDRSARNYFQIEEKDFEPTRPAPLSVDRTLGKIRSILLRTHRHRLLYGIILVGCVVRFLYPMAVNPLGRLYSDPLRHYENAKSFLSPPLTSLLDPIGYQVWLWAILKITAEHPWAVALCSAILCMLTPWVWYRWAREALPEKTAALTFFGVIAWMPSWIGIYGYFMTETILLPFTGVALWMTWRAARKQTSAAYCLACILWILTLLIKIVPLPIALVTVIWMTWKYWRNHRWKLLYPVLASACIVAFLCVAAGVRSYIRLGEWEPFGHPQLNHLYMRSGMKSIEVTYTRNGVPLYFQGFQSPSLGEYRPLSPLSDWKSKREGKYETQVDLLDPAYQRWNKSVNSPLSLFELIKENSIFMLFGASWPDNNPQSLVQNIQIQLRWIWFPLLAFVTYQTIRRKDKNVMTLACLFIWICLLLSPTGVAEGRYRKVAEGILLACAVRFLTSSRKTSLEHEERAKI